MVSQEWVDSSNSKKTGSLSLCVGAQQWLCNKSLFSVAFLKSWNPYMPNPNAGVSNFQVCEMFLSLI